MSTLYGERMAYKCLDGGASPSASMSIECQADGHWSDPPEACVFVSCGRPPTALNTSPKILERPNTNTFPDTSLIELSVAVGGIIQFPCKLGKRKLCWLILNERDVVFRHLYGPHKIKTRTKPQKHQSGYDVQNC